MPYLHCKTHGPEREAVTIGNQELYRQEGESVLVIHGTLSNGPWLCDRCNAELGKGEPAYLFTAFPAHCREHLYDYDFGYELDYFAMAESDQATVYGAPWPDGSIGKRRLASRRKTRSHKEPLCALDLFPDGCP